MEKIKINKQIISMRKYVKQAKVRMINKLVKAAKTFQNKHGDDIQQQKYKRKAKKLLSEIEIIKKLNVDDISKAALMKEKNWQEVLISKNATVEERSFALLANYDAVQSEVESFHKENSELVQLLPDLIKHWDEKKVFRPGKNAIKASELRLRKKERMLKKRKLQRTNNKNEAAPKKVPSANADDCEDDFDVRDEYDKDSGAQAGAIEDQENSVDSREISDYDSKLEKFIGNENSEENADEKTPESKSDTADLSDSVGSKLCKTKTKAQQEIACLKLGELKGKDTISVSSDRDFSEEDDTDSIGEKDDNLKNDPFFMSGDDPIAEDEHGKSSDSDSPERKMPFRTDKSQSSKLKRGGSPASRNFKSRGMHRKRSEENGRNSKPWQNRSEIGAPGRNFRGRASRGTSSRGGSRQRFLQKNQEQRTSSKIDFKRNINAGGKMLPSELNGKSIKEREKINTKTAISTSTALHPSWEAKRKLKQNQMHITPFQGVKIKFED